MVENLGQLEIADADGFKNPDKMGTQVRRERLEGVIL
jgi:hypothetical protein